MQLLDRHRGAGRHAQEEQDVLLTPFRGHADGCRLGDIVVATGQLLDLRGGDVFAPPTNAVLQSVYEVVPTVRATKRVAGVEPKVPPSPNRVIRSTSISRE